jgi:hypothetical protein
MKNIYGNFLISIFRIVYVVFMITALVTHIWTVIIAFNESGFIGGILTLFLPFLSEIYWMIKMFGENDLYAYIALVHLILVVPISLLGGGRNYMEKSINIIFAILLLLCLADMPYSYYQFVRFITMIDFAVFACFAYLQKHKLKGSIHFCYYNFVSAIFQITLCREG